MNILKICQGGPYVNSGFGTKCKS